MFLALALGILVGTTGLNGAILSDLKKQVRTLRGETSSLRASNDSLTTVANNDEKFASTYMKPILAGRLDRADRGPDQRAGDVQQDQEWRERRSRPRPGPRW